ncbi:hypothetical protein GGF50DRAFT_120945 [Schizophyllum commune]
MDLALTVLIYSQICRVDTIPRPPTCVNASRRIHCRDNATSLGLAPTLSQIGRALMILFESGVLYYALPIISLVLDILVSG